jgi:murein L,D-transpeptidase YafK
MPYPTVFLENSYQVDHNRTQRGEAPMHPCEPMKITMVLKYVLLLLLMFSFSVFAVQEVVADKVLIEKKARRLTLFSKGQALRTYKVALGRNPNGPKERAGDNKTPEGVYTIDARNKNSRYHLSLHISYPNDQDRKRAKELGVSPGGDIMIHGIRNGFGWLGGVHRWLDWTQGCVAVTDDEIKEIDRLVPNGTTVEISP